MAESVDYSREDAVETRVTGLLDKMTLAEKVGQLVQVDPVVLPDLEGAVREGRVG